MNPLGMRFWRRTSVRLTVLVATVFALSTAVIGFFIYGLTVAAFAQQIDRAVQEEMRALDDIYERGGLNQLNREIVRRTFAQEEFAYLLAYDDGERISGQPDRLPAAALADDGIIRFFYELPDRRTGDVAERRAARGRVEVLPGDYRVLVWRDVEEDRRAVARVGGQVWAAVGLVLALGLLSGAWLSSRFVRRVDALNAVAQDVMEGDLTRRAPRNHTDDELDTLSGNINGMLDRLEELMTSISGAGDAIAHDLRSPITRLRNRLEAALIGEGEVDKADIESAICDADELLGTFSAVMRVSRLESMGKQTFQALDPGPLIRDLGELFEPACEEKGLDLEIDVAHDLSVRGDPALLSQAMSNLLDNAIKYTPAGGAVALRLRRRGDGRVEMSVTDTGPGVPAQDRERVTRRFVRLDGSRTEPGVGLGLSLVKAVAEAHDAALSLDDGAGVVGDQGPGLRVAVVFPHRGQNARAGRGA